MSPFAIDLGPEIVKDVAFNPAGTSVYVVSLLSNNGNVSVIDTTANKIVTTLQAGFGANKSLW